MRMGQTEKKNLCIRSLLTAGEAQIQMRFLPYYSARYLPLKKKLLVKHQIVGGDHFFGLEEGITDLLIQFGVIFIAQKFSNAVRALDFPVVGHKTGHLVSRLDQLLYQADCGDHMTVVAQIDKQNLYFHRLLPFVQYTTCP